MALEFLPEPQTIDFEELIYLIDKLFQDIYGYTDGNPPDNIETIQELRTEILNKLEELKVYDQAGYVIGKPEENKRVFFIVTTRNYKIPANFEGSQAKCGTAPKTSKIFTIKKNGDEIGTLSFEAGTNTGYFTASISGDISFTAGDVLEIWSPEIQDDDLADVGWNIKAYFI